MDVTGHGVGSVPGTPLMSTRGLHEWVTVPGRYRAKGHHMSRVTVSFTADSVSTEQGARDLIEGIAYDAQTRGIRDLAVVSVSQPVTFADQSAFEAAAREWLRSNH